MQMSRLVVSWLTGLALLAGGCGSRGVDWTQPENFLLREESRHTDDGIELAYWSLVDAPAQAVYDVLADLEHWPTFIPGVDNVQVLSKTGTATTVQISQRVIGRQSNAKVEWTYTPAERRIEFRTLSSTLSRNDGRYVIEPSPDGKRSLVRSTFVVHQGDVQAVPIGVLATGTRDAFLAAAQAIRLRAAGPVAG